MSAEGLKPRDGRDERVGEGVDALAAAAQDELRERRGQGRDYTGSSSTIDESGEPQERLVVANVIRDLNDALVTTFGVDRNGVRVNIIEGHFTDTEPPEPCVLIQRERTGFTETIATVSLAASGALVLSENGAGVELRDLRTEHPNVQSLAQVLGRRIDNWAPLPRTEEQKPKEEKEEDPFGLEFSLDTTNHATVVTVLRRLTRRLHRRVHDAAESAIHDIKNDTLRADVRGWVGEVTRVLNACNEAVDTQKGHIIQYLPETAFPRPAFLNDFTTREIRLAGLGRDGLKWTSGMVRFTDPVDFLVQLRAFLSSPGVGEMRVSGEQRDRTREQEAEIQNIRYAYEKVPKEDLSILQEYLRSQGEQDKERQFMEAFGRKSRWVMPKQKWTDQHTLLLKEYEEILARGRQAKGEQKQLDEEKKGREAFERVFTKDIADKVAARAGEPPAPFTERALRIAYLVFAATDARIALGLQGARRFISISVPGDLAVARVVWKEAEEVQKEVEVKDRREKSVEAEREAARKAREALDPNELAHLEEWAGDDARKQAAIDAYARMSGPGNRALGLAQIKVDQAKYDEVAEVLRGFRGGQKSREKSSELTAEQRRAWVRRAGLLLTNEHERRMMDAIKGGRITNEQRGAFKLIVGRIGKLHPSDSELGVDKAAYDAVATVLV